MRFSWSLKTSYALFTWAQGQAVAHTRTVVLAYLTKLFRRAFLLRLRCTLW